MDVTVVVNRQPAYIGCEVPEIYGMDDHVTGGDPTDREEAGRGEGGLLKARGQRAEREGHERSGGESFEAFFDRVLPRAIGVGRRVLGSHSDAEDAAVEALARAYVRWGELGGAAYRDAWVLRVAANVAYDQLRRQVRGRRHDRSEPAPMDSGGEAAHAVELRWTLVPLLRRLSRRQREVVILSYMVGLSHEEIADLLGCSVGSVKVHARRGLERLRGDLEGLRAMAEEDR